MGLKNCVLLVILGAFTIFFTLLSELTAASVALTGQAMILAFSEEEE